MFDNLYNNIGDKIKKSAKGIFIVEAIGTVIIGLIMFFTDELSILFGLLTLLFGPIVAFIKTNAKKVTANGKNLRFAHALHIFGRYIHTNRNC